MKYRGIVMLIRAYAPADEDAVISLWQRCGLTRPWNDPRKDIERKMLVRPDLFLVGVIEGVIVATAMAGYDGHRGWVYYLGVDPQQQRKGLGRLMMERVEELLRAEGCPKINLQVRTSNEPVIAFYQRLGYSVDEVAGMGKRLERDEPTEQSKPAEGQGCC
jgi:ribosomal protein S18 acetylase RimI-like enzyme